MRLTSSSIGTLQACAENYRLRYIEKLEAIDKPHYLTLGTAFHAGVEVFRKGSSRAESRAHACSVAGGLSNDDLCVLVSMMDAYCHKYCDEKGAFVRVEHEFSHPMLHPIDVDICGVVDAIAKAGDGHIIYETKTVGRIDGAYIDRLWSSRQSLIYNWVLNEHEWNIQGVMYDLVQKPTIRRLKATPMEKRKWVIEKGTGRKRLSGKQREHDQTDAEFLERLHRWYAENPDAFHRELVVHSPHQLEQIEADVRNEVLRIAWHTEYNVWPRSLASCHRFNRPCEFAPLCGAANPQLIKDTHYQKREVTHAELTEEKNGKTNRN
jgi:hypothetical protein